MPEIQRYIAPAKINLGLRVRGRRADGYHEIDTIFYRILEPYDSIEVTESEAFRFTCSDPKLPTDGRNIMMRAAHIFARSRGVNLPPVHIHLEKRIPMGAGLGGGSSDAATMLQILIDGYALNDKFGIRDDFGQLGTNLGADVPFFVSGAKAAHATGIGEILSPIELDLACSILVVFDPKIHVSTKEVYQSLELPALGNLERNADDRSSAAYDKLVLEELRNDFEPYVFARHPKLARIKESMYGHGCKFALLSGSGSAIYGLFDDLGIAVRAKTAFEMDGLMVYLS
jgi:4-diphosphocytidyl-2-C-methyl-D-erythritol kinase